MMNFSRNIRPILALLIVLALLAITLVLLFRQPESKDLSLLIGALIGSVTTAIGFYFGSSDNQQPVLKQDE